MEEQKRVVNFIYNGSGTPDQKNAYVYCFGKKREPT